VTPLTSTFVQTNGIQLHVMQAGPPTGTPVILLHGFPEFWYGWRHQISTLAEAGLRVWAPDQRGYNLSDKPHGLAAYTLDRLAEDILGLMDVGGVSEASIVGHDWGSAVAWWLALHHPQRQVVRQSLWHHPAQLFKSAYIAFFQLPWLPEALLRANDWRLIEQSFLRTTNRPDLFTPEVLACYREAWSQSGAMTAMLNWYRSALRRQLQPLPEPRVRVPTLMIWGTHDPFLGRELAQPSIDLCDQGRLVFLEEATHWVQHEAAARVNELLIDFLAIP
jgi:epoxide hydrolase 4